MELSKNTEAEEIITKILSKREILKKKTFSFAGNPVYNLGEFLKNIPQESNKYDTRFVFVK